MRIIYLHQYFNTPDMAGGTRSFEFGRRLVAAGHRVEMITSWQEPSVGKDWFMTEVEGINVHWLPVPYSNDMGYWSRIRAFSRFAHGAAWRAAGLDADVVFATSTPLTIALPAVFAARRKRIPMVFEVRDLWPQLPIAMGALKSPASRWAARRLERFSYFNAAQVVALSSDMARGVASTGYPKHRITVVPNGSDLDFFRRDPERGRAFRQALGIADDRIVVAYTGTLGRINGVGYLARVAAILKDDSRFVFLTVGDGHEKDQVRQLARELSILDRNFFMLAKVTKAQMPMVLSGVDVATSLCLPIPELEANSANKFFDALAAGCCVAVNYGGWQADLLREVSAGVRLASTPGEGARSLQDLASDPCRIRAAGENARQLAEQRFSRDDLAVQIESILERAVTAGSRHTARRAISEGA